MNLIEIAEDLKNVPDQYLMQEVQQPTGNYPAYLVVSELSRRKRMREKVAKEMPTQTVAEELATPPQPQMPQGMPQMGTMMPQGAPQGLMAMPQAQTELAAQDAMGTTPPEMMTPQQMAGGGMVSFRQGGDVIHAANGLPMEQFEYFPRSSLDPYVAPGTPLPNTVSGLRRLGEAFPTTGRLFGMGEDRLYIDPVTQEPITYQEFLRKYPQSAAETRRLQSAASMPAAVVPAAVAASTAAPAGAAPAGVAPAAPAGTPPAAPPVARATTIPVQPAPSVPEALTPYALATIGAQGASDYEQAVPDRTTKYFTEDIARREADIEKRRATNINDALIQAGLGAMRAKPKFRGSAGLFEVIGEGGQAGFDVLRQGRKDIMQSEEAINAARAKMVEAEMLRDDRKYKAASDARKEAIELNNYGLNLAKTQSAIALQNVNAQVAAQKLPAEIGLLESQAYALRNRPAGLDKTIATQEQISKARVEALTDLALKGIKSPTKAQMDAALDAALAQSGLRRVMAGIPAAMPTAIDYSQAINASVSGN
jgi:hypothetical protein